MHPAKLTQCKILSWIWALSRISSFEWTRRQKWLLGLLMNGAILSLKCTQLKIPFSTHFQKKHPLLMDIFINLCSFNLQSIQDKSGDELADLWVEQTALSKRLTKWQMQLCNHGIHASGLAAVSKCQLLRLSLVCMPQLPQPDPLVFSTIGQSTYGLVQIWLA